jgi:hypothetical protein
VRFFGFHHGAVLYSSGIAAASHRLSEEYLDLPTLRTSSLS